jgi:hypothetical protein
MIRNPYNPFPSKSDLREACEESLFGSSYGEHICDSTIEKDLFAMRMDHDAPIKYSKRNEGYYYENPDFSINDSPLSEDELSAIRFAVQTLQQFQEVPYFKEFGNAIDKIANRVSIVSPDDEDVSKYVGFETILSAGGTHYLPDLLSQVKPDLVIYDAGVDTHVGDRLGKLALTDEGIYRRERQVLSTCRAGGYPVACVIGGGYAEEMEDLVYRHSLLHRAATDVYF